MQLLVRGHGNTCDHRATHLRVHGTAYVASAGGEHHFRDMPRIGRSRRLVGKHLAARVLPVLPAVFRRVHDDTSDSHVRPAGLAKLGQQEGDTGSASSLMAFINTVVGCLGMMCATVLPFAYVTNLGWTIVMTTLAGLALWVFLLRSPIPLKGIKR